MPFLEDVQAKRRHAAALLYQVRLDRDRRRSGRPPIRLLVEIAECLWHMRVADSRRLAWYEEDVSAGLGKAQTVGGQSTRRSEDDQ